MKKKIAILASGGNAPGMNNGVIAFIKKCFSVGLQPVLIHQGFQGIVKNQLEEVLDSKRYDDYIRRGNVFIQSSRFPEFAQEKNQKIAADILRKSNIQAVVVLGGEGSFQGAAALDRQGIKTFAIPCTIDNDVASSDATIGFDTCLNQIITYIQDLNDCFASHDGISIVEIMGRDCPDLSIYTAIANNVDHVITKYNILSSEEFVSLVKKLKNQKNRHLTIAVSEKIYGRNGHEDLDTIAKKIGQATGCMTRFTKLGYVQRAGSPSFQDRYLANMMVYQAIDLYQQNQKSAAICFKDHQFSQMPLQEAIACSSPHDWTETISAINKINEN